MNYAFGKQKTKILCCCPQESHQIFTFMLTNELDQMNNFVNSKGKKGGV